MFNFQNLIQDSITVKQKLLNEDFIATVEKASQKILNSFTNNKLLLCGNGGSAADAQHIAAEFINRFETERRPLPAIALTTDSSNLTAIGNDYDFDQVFSKQVLALGNPKDVLLAITTSGNSGNILQAILAAKEKGMDTILLTGKDGGKAIQLLDKNDIAIIIPSDKTSRIQESHLLVAHCICSYVDNKIPTTESTCA